MKSLDTKVQTKEIRGYQLTENKLFIQKSKRSKCTIDMTGIPGHILIRLLQKRIPDPGQMNTAHFFNKEIRDLKLKELI